MSESASPENPYVIETDQERFEADVFERSKTVPVVVDFWATWCAPCRTLEPILERLADEYAGGFVLVKAETDRVAEAASEFNVQSIPAVYAVINGDVVDFFQGVLPEDQLKAWLDQLLLYSKVSQTEQLEQSDPQAAEAQYREIVTADPNNFAAQIGLARVLGLLKRTDEAREIIETLENRGFLEPEAEKVKATLDLQSFDDIDLEEVRAAVKENPDDLEQQLRLAEALAANQDYTEAMDVCLSIVQRDRTGAGEKAREVMVDIFRVLSDEDLVREYRRKLSTLLY
jgi:putative thioredoxin